MKMMLTPSSLWRRPGALGWPQTGGFPARHWSEADAPTLRLQFEDGTDKAGFNFTPESAGGWNHYKFALADFSYWDGSTAFDTSAITVFQVLSEGNGASGRTFHFDNVPT